jgi:hypothetical protein
MPSPNLINRFATQLLSPDHIHIAAELVDSHIDKEMASLKPDKAKLAELFSLKTSVDKAAGGNESE